MRLLKILITNTRCDENKLTSRVDAGRSRAHWLLFYSNNRQFRRNSCATFNFVNRKSKPTPNFADNSESVHTLIQNAITNNLAGQGLSRVNAGGDVTIAYLVIKGDNVSTTSISDY